MTKLKFKVEGGKIFSAEKQSFPREDAGNCPLCDMPVYVSHGQAITRLNGAPTHKSCRKNRDKV